MCIRDRNWSERFSGQAENERYYNFVADKLDLRKDIQFNSCLLYTSDAADERSSVDLGGRRIIKKKKHHQKGVHCKAYTDTSHKNNEGVRQKYRTNKKNTR